MRGLWSFIAILFITISLLLLYSFYRKTIKVLDIEIKKTDWKNYIIEDTTPKSAMVAVNVDLYRKRELDTNKQIILLIGDSMLEQLRKAMFDYCTENGHSLQCVIWYSSQSQWYGSSDTLHYFIKKYKPTYVFLVLGANELFVTNIKEKRAIYVKNIVQTLEKNSLPFVWVGPPNWKQDTGINELILQYAGYDRYFATYKISLNNPNFKRFKDGAHPMQQSAYFWMDELAKWVVDFGRYPIKLNPPTVKAAKLPPTQILQPLN